MVQNTRVIRLMGHGTGHTNNRFFNCIILQNVKDRSYGNNIIYRNNSVQKIWSTRIKLTRVQNAWTT